MSGARDRLQQVDQTKTTTDRVDERVLSFAMIVQQLSSHIVNPDMLLDYSELSALPSKTHSSLLYVFDKTHFENLRNAGQLSADAVWSKPDFYPAVDRRRVKKIKELEDKINQAVHCLVKEKHSSLRTLIGVLASDASLAGKDAEAVLSHIIEMAEKGKCISKRMEVRLGFFFLSFQAKEIIYNIVIPRAIAASAKSLLEEQAKANPNQKTLTKVFRKAVDEKGNNKWLSGYQLTSPKSGKEIISHSNSNVSMAPVALSSGESSLSSPKSTASSNMPVSPKTPKTPQSDTTSVSRNKQTFFGATSRRSFLYVFDESHFKQLQQAGSIPADTKWGRSGLYSAVDVKRAQRSETHVPASLAARKL